MKPYLDKNDVPPLVDFEYQCNIPEHWGRVIQLTAYKNNLIFCCEHGVLNFNRLTKTVENIS